MVKFNLLRESALDKTIEEIPNADEVGLNTDRLSDISEHDDNLLLTRHGHTGWMEKIRPLVQKKDVRIISMINIVFIVLNFIVFVIFVGYTTYGYFKYINLENMKKNDMPCLYQWTEWSACSHTCRPLGGSMPMMTRRVRNDSVIQARGKYVDIAPCSPDVRQMIDRAPCNVFDCPRKLSSFEKTVYYQTEHNVYHKMRNLPRGLLLVEIDTDDISS